MRTRFQESRARCSLFRSSGSLAAGIYMFALAIFWQPCQVEAAAADMIYFKDGMRMICHGGAREQNNEIHCEYDGGILIYPKADVLSIERGPASAQQRTTQSNEETGPPPPPQAKPEIPKGLPSMTSTGMAFYDPRRPKRYWSHENRHHDSYQDAIAALGQEFDKSPQWVEAHMGDSNDIKTIRANLLAGLAETGTNSDPASLHQNRTGVEFYNARRSQKYWTGPESRHNTFKEAIETLAREFNMPVAWVETHMGDSNDTERIRQSLREAPKEQSDR